jgi:hypothetical protein
MSDQNIANAPKYNKNRNSTLNANPKKPPLNAKVPTGAAIRANHFVEPAQGRCQILSPSPALRTTDFLAPPPSSGARRLSPRAIFPAVAQKAQGRTYGLLRNPVNINSLRSALQNAEWRTGLDALEADHARDDARLENCESPWSTIDGGVGNNLKKCFSRG